MYGRSGLMLSFGRTLWRDGALFKLDIQNSSFFTLFVLYDDVQRMDEVLDMTMTIIYIHDFT